MARRIDTCPQTLHALPVLRGPPLLLSIPLEGGVLKRLVGRRRTLGKLKHGTLSRETKPKSLEPIPRAPERGGQNNQMTLAPILHVRERVKDIDISSEPVSRGDIGGAGGKTSLSMRVNKNSSTSTYLHT